MPDGNPPDPNLPDALPRGLGPFSRPIRILDDEPRVSFHCPIRDAPVAWAAKDVFNAGAVVRGGKVCLLVRCEDMGPYAGVSRIGLATSADGRAFTLEPEPVIFPQWDDWQTWEWPGGCEDPRVVEHPDGGYVATYTAFDGKVACLFTAASPDLRQWAKHGPAFERTAYVRTPSKSGAIVTELRDGRLVAARLGGKFWMYWGEGVIYAATSEDLVSWAPVEIEVSPDHYLAWRPGTPAAAGAWLTRTMPRPKALHPVAAPRPGRFDSFLVEPGPPAVLTEAGIVLIYNGVNLPTGGDPDSPAYAYQPAQLLLDPAAPTAVIERPTEPFLRIDPVEAAGQVRNVVFAEGLAAFKGEWLLYLGLADSRVGVAAAPMA